MISQGEVVLRLIVATMFGGLIGLERESHKRPAGFRTHILVCIGSALAMIISQYAFLEFSGKSGYDPGRIAAQVISGIGFLGAGTILREGATIKGLTTAASLWVVAGIGLAVGTGFYVSGAVTTGLVVVVLVVFDRFERRFMLSKRDTLFVQVSDRPGQLGAIASVLGRYGVSIKEVDMETVGKGHEAAIHLSLEVPFSVPKDRLLDEIIEVDGVIHVGYEE
ncbi:MAG TPA: MgtC/SapB family protein [Bacillota bacterium]|nr:MgtC/SapB family protein [Bacillota bacterium]